MRLIVVIVDLHLEAGVLGAIEFARESFYNDLISAIDLRSYNGLD